VVNPSKVREERYWKRWSDAGAVEDMRGAYQRTLFNNEKSIEQKVQENMPLNGIEVALRDGSKLHGFRSGGGLRVIRIEKNDKLLGYGEHFSVDHALLHADEDYVAGSRNYPEVYGGKYPHYLTGSTDSTSPLDEWLLKGNSVDARFVEGRFVVSLEGYYRTETPDEIMETTKLLGTPVTWTDRGFTYETTMVDENSFSTQIIQSPSQRKDGWIYKATKTGAGKDFKSAVEQAFLAEKVELKR